MWKYTSKLLTILVCAGGFMHACQAAPQQTILTAKDLPYFGSITLSGVGGDSSGARVISYHVHLSSSKCKSDLTGVAKFYSANESPTVDSEFLPNGHVVKTSMFKDENRYGGLDLVWDVESKNPQYAAVYVKNYSDIDRGGCIDKSEAGYEFYDWKK
jgi:hypothetical protein